jgi:hypothetical protein
MSQYANVQAFSSVLTTELNSLADAANSNASSNQDNSTNLYGFADVSVVLGAINPTSAGARLEIHLIPRLADGSTYADLSASTIVGTVVVDTSGSNTKEGMLRGVPIPPGFFQWRATNRTGVTLAASGNTMSVRYYDIKGG